jgi:hypothetical protein
MKKFASYSKQGLALALLLTPSVVPPAFAQAIFESGATNAMAAGLGAGAAASAGRGKFLQRAYNSAAEAQRAALAQTQAISAYMKQGCDFEAKKQWDNAERCFKYCLQVSSLRDGPGSAKMIPTLEHLVTVKAAQRELNDAIGFQQRLVSFAKLDKVPDPARIIGTQVELSSLLMQKNDFENAEQPLRESYTLARTTAGIPASKRRVLCDTYAKVLHYLRKEEEASSVEAAAAALLEDTAPAVAATNASAADPAGTGADLTNRGEEKPTGSGTEDKNEVRKGDLSVAPEANPANTDWPVRNAESQNQAPAKDTASQLAATERH